MSGEPIDIIAGARPNFMKIAPIIREIDARRGAGSRLGYRLVHTGQHYDARMSNDFFEQLGIPAPDANLEAGGGTQAEQTANIMVRYERLLSSVRPWMCMVVGDVTSTMACAITAQKMRVPVAHVEAGIRSGDWEMPEEINRIVTDSITNHFFTTTEAAGATLRRTGVAEAQIHFVGNTMIDSLLANRNRFRAPEFWDRAGLVAGDYLVATLHRPSNVDDPKKLSALVHAISGGARGRSVVFPVHPRTAKALASIGPLPSGVIPVEPQPYLEFNYLVANALGVITDSGGVTEETTVLGIPCMTLRTTTERPETVTMGTNELLGVDPAAIPPALSRLLDGQWKKGIVPPLWDGRAAERIVTALELMHPTR
jgi:UDP-N-acetylglucosamine 2-epimerase (non-hydrolysing)